MTSRGRVAIVDDDPQVRSALQLLLSTACIQAEAFDSAEELLSSQERESIGCLLLDVRLPGMTGIELLKVMNERSATGPPIIIITGHGDVAMAVTAMRAGAFHFVEKPFDPEALLAICKEALSRADRQINQQQRVHEIQQRYKHLTERERQVLKLLVDGLPSKLIAYELGISTRTAEHHRSAVMKKMKARTLSHLVRMALDIENIVLDR
jgi:two-component system, LuxR family, response regulator FixJ